MIGAADIGNCMQDNGDFDDLAGITPRAISELYRLLNERTAQISYEVEISMFQLYRDGLEDLLIDKPKKKKGQEVYICIFICIYMYVYKYVMYIYTHIYKYIYI
jgi:hypothetical protein